MSGNRLKDIEVQVLVDGQWLDGWLDTWDKRGDRWHGFVRSTPHRQRTTSAGSTKMRFGRPDSCEGGSRGVRGPRRLIRLRRSAG
jgi:hypothetical protein